MYGQNNAPALNATLTTFEGTSSSRRLSCLIEGDDTIFTVKVKDAENEIISELKDLVHAKGQHGNFSGIDAKELMLLQVDIPLDGYTRQTLPHLRVTEGDQDLIDWKPVSKFWKAQPSADNLHIFVKSPADVPPSPSKRRRTDSEPRTPKKIPVQLVQAQVSPQGLNIVEARAALKSSILGFEDYFISLASGKLDGFLNSLRREDKTAGLEVHMPDDPILLLHDLGKYPNQKRIKELFTGGTVHSFSVPGAGKTRLALDGLCQNWGLYINCRPLGPGSGSDDFSVATGILQGMSGWNMGESPGDIIRNTQAADRTFAMLLCARIFILMRLVTKLPVSTDATLARRRWVLAQVLPPSRKYAGPSSDLFAVVLRSLRHVDTNILHQLIQSLMLLLTKRSDLFPEGSDTKLFVVIDKAQVAADHLKEYFRSTTTDMRPILHEMYRFLLEFPSVVGGVISLRDWAVDANGEGGSVLFPPKE